MEWNQPRAFERYYEFLIDGELTGTLKFAKSSETLATAEYGGRRWTFKRSGFWSPKISVHDTDTDNEVAVFNPRWKGGGELVFATGQRFLLKSLSFLGLEWAFETDSGQEIVSLDGPHGLFHNRAAASFGLGAATMAETPILVSLIWYLRLLMQEEQTVVNVCCG